MLENNSPDNSARRHREIYPAPTVRFSSSIVTFVRCLPNICKPKKVEQRVELTQALNGLPCLKVIKDDSRHCKLLTSIKKASIEKVGKTVDLRIIMKRGKTAIETYSLLKGGYAG